jgi:hypothetical protein
MTQTDVELQQLREVWNEPDRETDGRIAALHRAVAGQALRLRLTLAAEVALTVVSLVTLVLVWRRVPGTRTMLIIAAALLHTAVIWAYAVWNRRGQWNPVAVTVRDAVQVRRAHYRRRLAAYRFVVWLAAIEGVLLLGLLALPDIKPWPILFTLLFLAGAVAWTVFDSRRLRRELNALDEFAREIENTI